MYVSRYSTGDRERQQLAGEPPPNRPIATPSSAPRVLAFKPGAVRPASPPAPPAPPQRAPAPVGLPPVSRPVSGGLNGYAAPGAAQRWGRASLPISRRRRRHGLAQRRRMTCGGGRSGRAGQESLTWQLLLPDLGQVVKLATSAVLLIDDAAR
jgi:hypothetical protein